ncbi:MAG TPA: hypothetical protein VFD21_13840 [Vicinamibacterales bacterium]|nr:hypothetical protein [Vicinamibacterales bacterium]
MAEGDAQDTDPTLVERWLQDQQQWQRTLFTYLDSMMKNDEFLMHMGNAMRGSLLAGKPYPTATPPPVPADDPATADRLDKVLFALHQLQGQVKDILMTLDEMRGGRSPAAHGARKKTRVRKASSGSSRKTGKRRTRS